MFNIYSTQGRIFSGPLESLREYRRVEKASNSHSANKLENVLNEDELLSKQSYKASKQALDQYQQLLQDKQAPNPVYQAYQIMTQPVIFLYSHLSLQKAYEYFEQYPFQLLPVLNDKRQLISLLSRSDLYKEMLERKDTGKQSSSSITEWLGDQVQEVITTEPVTDIRRIAAVLSHEKMGAIPIVEDNGRLVGIVSRTDILNCLTKEPPLSLWC